MHVCLDQHGVCTASTYVPTAQCASAQTNVPIYLFDQGDNGWKGSTFSLTNPSGVEVVNATLTSGFYGVDDLCLGKIKIRFYCSEISEASQTSEVYIVAILSEAYLRTLCRFILAPHC